MFSFKINQQGSKAIKKLSIGLLLAWGANLGSLYAEDDFFALPSPSEILADAESEGLSVALSKSSLAVLQVDLKALAKSDPTLACYNIGRLFSVTGYGFKQLNNKVILQLAQKVLGGARSLDLPEVISQEINHFYDLMISKSNWDRNELLLSFTTARASLMYLLKDSGKVPSEDQVRLDSYGAALECGMWFQSLQLAIENLKDDQMEAFNSVYLDPDYLTYFDKILKRPRPKDSDPIFQKMIQANDLSLKAIEDESVTRSEVDAISAALAEVIK